MVVRVGIGAVLRLGIGVRDELMQGHLGSLLSRLMGSNGRDDLIDSPGRQ